jgi:hypothetical protein
MEAERDKIKIAAAITVGVKPEVFAPEVSGRGHNRGTQDAALKTAALPLNLRTLGGNDAALKSAALRLNLRNSRCAPLLAWLLPGVFGLFVERIGREFDQLQANVIGVVDI